MKTKPESLIVLAGAGMSVDSGLPPLWTTQNLYEFFPPAKSRNIEFTALGQPKWFLIDPKFAWGFYGKRAQVYSKAIPHEGYSEVINWGISLPNGCSVITSNVDGLFHKTDDRIKVEEIHGSIFYVQCSRNCCDDIWKLDLESITINEDGYAEKYPVCQKCGHPARPNILMFNDHSWNPKRTYSQSFDLYDSLEKHLGRQTLLLEVGAGTRVPSIRLITNSIKEKLNSEVIRINPDKKLPLEKEVSCLYKDSISGIKEVLKMFN